MSTFQTEAVALMTVHVQMFKCACDGPVWFRRVGIAELFRWTTWPKWRWLCLGWGLGMGSGEVR